MNVDEKHDDRFSSKFVNLADEKLGSKVLHANDEFFAKKENLLMPGRGIFIPDKYTDHGKWMDGWETRRRRTPGHDHCIIQLGCRGAIHGIDIDTNHFLGNHPPHAAVDACQTDSSPTAQISWTEILPKSPLRPGIQNLFPIQNDNAWSHVRLNIYPDGGVARFRVYGEIMVDWTEKQFLESVVDLASVERGGRVLICNDMFFSSKDNLIMPGRGKNMGDGWETKRRRRPGHDWVILALGHSGTIKRVEVDTAHFKGNYPDKCSLDAIQISEKQSISSPDLAWKKVLSEQKLEPDCQHYYESEVEDIGPVSHVRLNIFPDGGVSRLRIYGKIHENK